MRVTLTRKMMPASHNPNSESLPTKTRSIRGSMNLMNAACMLASMLTPSTPRINIHR